MPVGLNSDLLQLERILQNRNSIHVALLACISEEIWNAERMTIGRERFDERRSTER